LRLVVAITGASGVIYGIRTLEVLKRLKIDTHLIITEWGGKNIKIETDSTADYVKSLATRYYEDDNMAAPVSSGSFKVDGMIVIPCCIKEQRKLVLVPRETPLSKIHLKNMTKLASTSAVILPAMPGFYHRPKTMDDLINHLVGKVLDQFNIDHSLFKRWSGG
jgi:4-hydroxy-3-polyprenylbenzoate decarboxylase